MNRNEFNQLSPEEKQTTLSQMSPVEVRNLMGSGRKVYSNGELKDEILPDQNYCVLKWCAFFVPLVGFIAGAVLSGQPKREELGKSCLVRAIAGLFFYALIWIAWIVVVDMVYS